MPEATPPPSNTYMFADGDGDLLTIGRAAFPASGTPSVSIYTPSGEPVHVPAEQVPEVIGALSRMAEITPALVLSAAERAYLRAALGLLSDGINDGVTDEPEGFTAVELADALASLRKLAGGESR